MVFFILVDNKPWKKKRPEVSKQLGSLLAMPHRLLAGSRETLEGRWPYEKFGEL